MLHDHRPIKEIKLSFLLTNLNPMKGSQTRKKICVCVRRMRRRKSRRQQMKGSKEEEGKI